MELTSARSAKTTKDGSTLWSMPNNLAGNRVLTKATTIAGRINTKISCTTIDILMAPCGEDIAFESKPPTMGIRIRKKANKANNRTKASADDCSLI